MTWRDAAGLACLLWCAALLAWSDRPAPAAAESCRASQPVSQDGGLATYCLTFTPSMDFAHLVLAVDPLVFSGALYLDNLRVDAACTP